MPSPKSTCPICYNEYNQAIHTPRIVPSCGHTFCTKCLTGLISHSLIFHCPVDRTTYNLVTRNVSSFPINYALQDIISEDANYELCQHHEERMRLVCISDQCKVCDDCVLYGSHRGHEIKPLKKVQAEANKKIESLEGKLGEIKGWQRKFTDTLNDKEKSFIEAVKKRFDSLRTIIKEKEEEIYQEVQTFFNNEKKEVNSYLGEGSSIQKAIKNDIASLKEASKDKNIAKAFQAGSSQSLANLNNGFFQQRLQDLGKRLQEIEASIDQPLMSQILLFKNLEIKVSEKLDSSRGPGQRSASDAFLKCSPAPFRALNIPKVLNLEKNDSFDTMVPVVSSARHNNENREIKMSGLRYEGPKCSKILRDTFLQNSPRNSIRPRPRILQRDCKNYEAVNKTTFQW